MLYFHIVFDLSAINVHLCGRFSFLVGELLKDARNRNSNPNKKDMPGMLNCNVAHATRLFFHPAVLCVASIT